MGFVVLAVRACHLGVAEMRHDPAQIMREGGTGQAPNILEQEATRAYFANGPNHFGPHVAGISMSAVFATDREGLARRPACDEIKTGEAMPRHIAHVRLFERPFTDMLDATLAVVQHRFHSVIVPFHHKFVMEARTGQAEREATAAAE